MNRINDIASLICEVISTIFIGVALGVGFALAIVITEIGLFRF